MKTNPAYRLLLSSTVTMAALALLTGCGTMTDSMQKAAVKRAVESYKAPTGIFQDDTSAWEGQTKDIVPAPKGVDGSGPYAYHWKPDGWSFRTVMDSCVAKGNTATADVTMTMGAKLVVTDLGSGTSFVKDCSMKASGTLDLIKVNDDWSVTRVPELEFRSDANAPDIAAYGRYGYIEPNPVRIGDAVDFRAGVLPAVGSQATPGQVWVRSRSEIGTMQRWMLPGIETGAGATDYKSWFPSWPLLEGNRWGAIFAIDSTTLNDPATVAGISARTFRFTVAK